MFYQIPYRKNCGLRFIGNLPVSEGDLVWTDGNVIFGHVSPKGTPLLTSYPPVVPALGFDNFKGFISQLGKYSYNKNFISADWITNNEQELAYGDGLLNGQRVIDALLTDYDNDLFVVAEGFYQKNNVVQYYNPLHKRTLESPNQWVIDNLIDPLNDYYPYTVLNQISYGRGSLISLGQSYFGADKDNDIIIYKNGAEFSRHNLKHYADLTVDEALRVKDKIMAYSVREGLSLMTDDDPPDSFISSVFARVLMFNIKQNGDWDAIITTSAYGFCFPFLSFDASMFYASFPDNEDKVFSELLDLCMTKLEINLYDDHYIPISVTRYPQFTGNKKDDGGNYTPAYKQYILDKCEYYIPLVKFRHNVWFPALFHAAFTFKIHNGVIVDTVNSYSGGGLNIPHDYLKQFDKAIAWDERSITVQEINIAVETKEIRKSFDFPIGDDYYFTASNGAFQAIFNNDGKLLLDLTNIPNFDEWKNCMYENYVELPAKLHATGSDSKVSYWTSQWNCSSNNIFNQSMLGYWDTQFATLNWHGYWWTYRYYQGSEIPFINPLGTGLDTIEIDYWSQEKFYGHSGWLTFYIDENHGSHSAQKYYDFQSVPIPSLPDFVFDWTRIKVCFYELKKNLFLFGLRGYPLLLINENANSSLLGYGLKNFRLHKLKHKSKALSKN